MGQQRIIPWSATKVMAQEPVLPLDSCIHTKGQPVQDLGFCDLHLYDKRSHCLMVKKLWTWIKQRKGQKETRREKERLGRLGKLTVFSTRKMFGQMKMICLLSHLPICICPLLLHSKYIPEERCPNFGVHSLLVLRMALGEAILYLLPTIKIALPWTEFVSSEHEKELWLEERSHVFLSWTLHCWPLLLLHSQWWGRLTQPQWPSLTGCRPQWFSRCWGVFQTYGPADTQSYFKKMQNAHCHQLLEAEPTLEPQSFLGLYYGTWIIGVGLLVRSFCCYF